MHILIIGALLYFGVYFITTGLAAFKRVLFPPRAIKPIEGQIVFENLVEPLAVRMRETVVIYQREWFNV